MRTGRVALAAVVVVAAGACADGGSSAPPPATTPATTSPATDVATAAAVATAAPAATAAVVTAATIARTPEGLGATLQQWRDDEVAGRFQVRVDNGTSADVVVETLALEWSGFAVPARSEPRYRVGVGTSVDLTVPLPASRCSDPPSFDEELPADAPVAVVNGTERVPVTDVRGVLERIHTRSCTHQAVAHRATVAFGQDWELVEDRGDPVLRGHLVVAPRGSSTIELVGMDGSVLLSIEPVDGPAATDAPAAAAGRVPVDVGRLGRCDPHALADSKQTYVFDLALVVDGTPVDTSVVAEPWLQARMDEVIVARCGIS